LVNIVLHGINAVLLWLILRRLKISGAWLAAVIFAIHPVNVATVAWISEQKNTLSMFFSALALLLYLRFDESGHWSWYGFSITSFLLALLSKTAVVTLPFVILGCLWWRHGRVNRSDWLRSAPFLVLSCLLGLVTIWFQSHWVLHGTVIRPGSFLSRLLTASWIPWFYLSKALLPLNLTLVYPKWEADTSRLLSYLPAVILIGGFTIFWWKRATWGRPLFFGLGYFVVMLFPVLGFFDQGFNQVSLVADHWQYFSIVGAIALIVAAGLGISHRIGEWGQGLCAMTFTALVIALATASWQRAHVYVNDETLWRDAATRNPKAWLAYDNLGYTLLQQHKIEDSIGCFEQALRLKPDYPDAHNNLGVALQKRGALKEAIEHYEEAVRIRWDFAEAHDNLAVALSQQGRRLEAVQHWKQALRIKPDFADALINWGNSSLQVGRTEEAITSYERALQFEPNTAEVHNNLGFALVQAGRIQEAIRHYDRALQINPYFAATHYNLGNALLSSGKTTEAMAHYQQAVRFDPTNASAYNNLAFAFLTEGRTREAIDCCRHALELKPEYPEAHYNWGNALAVQGKTNDAIAQYNEALRLKPDFEPAQNQLARMRSGS